MIPHQGLRSLGGPHPSRTAPQGPTYEGMATPGPFGPCNFPCPILVSQHLGALGGFLGLLAAPPVVGLHPTGLQGLDCPASRPKSPESATEMSMGDPTCLKRCPGTTPHRAWKTSLDRPGEQPSLPHFLEFYENKIIQYAAFFFFFLAFSRILKCSHVVCINSLFLFIDERFTLYEYIAICWWSLELFLVCSSFLSLHNKLLQSKLHITTPIY